MSKNNQEIVNLLAKFADLLEATGDNPYKVRAYRRAAGSIARLSEELIDYLAQDKDLTSIPWIGKGIASSITHLLNNEELVLQEKK